MCMVMLIIITVVINISIIILSGTSSLLQAFMQRIYT